MAPDVVSLAPLAQATTERGFPWLRLPAPLEQAYQRSVEAQRQRALSRALIFCVPLYLILLWVDHEMVPELAGLSFTLRLGVFMPLVLVHLWLLNRLTSPKAREWVLASQGLCACLVSTLLSVAGHGPLRTEHLVILNAIVIYTVLFGRFWPMVVLCEAVVAMHLAALVHLGTLTSAMGVGTTLLLLANCTYMAYGCYLLEHASRQSFLVDIQEAHMDDQLGHATTELARVAREDALTGLANRRHFSDFLKQAHARAIQGPGQLAVVLIDIDHFKAFNDHHGHPQGDACLRQVGQALQAATPAHGLAARWGGEEFALVLPGADADEAADLAEQARAAVEALALPHGASPTGPVVTISLGVGTMQGQSGLSGQSGQSGLSMADLIAQADQALYTSKHSGRNRVTRGPGPQRAQA